MRVSHRVTAGLAAIAFAALTAGLAQADPNSPRIGFFGCVAGAPFAKSVPANVPLFISSGYSSGTFGLVVSATQKVENVFTVTSAGGSSTVKPPFGQPMQNPDGTWTAPFRADFPALASGESMTIRWTNVFRQPVKELVPPSSDWDPEANFQPPWDGTGLKYTNFTPAGVVDLGACTVTAV